MPRWNARLLQRSASEFQPSLYGWKKPYMYLTVTAPGLMVLYQILRVLPLQGIEPELWMQTDSRHALVQTSESMRLVIVSELNGYMIMRRSLDKSIDYLISRVLQ